MTIENRDVNQLLDDLMSDTNIQEQWTLNPNRVAAEYNLTEAQTVALLSGNVDSLIAEGLAARHVQEMRVSW
ncbi:MAG: hypothetical protein OXF79_24155 [Chloroflexi bacterium]|nr:hypothetical protein [Chloroflexota bacterium]